MVVVDRRSVVVVLGRIGSLVGLFVILRLVLSLELLLASCATHDVGQYSTWRIEATTA
jgi:hypothetical protein